MIVSTTWSTGCGANCGFGESSTACALSTRWSVGIPHDSKICVHRYEKKPLRSTIAFLPVANWRAAASIA